MATLTKLELAEEIFNTEGLNKREAKDVIECFFEEIKLNNWADSGVRIYVKYRIVD